jgi:uncharacterized protein (DUF305 family)
MFVSAIVIHHQMQLDLAGKLLVQPTQKLQEFLVAMPFVTLSHYPPL